MNHRSKGAWRKGKMSGERWGKFIFKTRFWDLWKHNPVKLKNENESRAGLALQLTTGIVKRSCSIYIDCITSMRCVSNRRSIYREVKDNSNVVFKLFCDVQNQKEPMNGESEQFLCCSHFIPRAENKNQFTEMDKMSSLRMKSQLNWDLTVT